MQLNRPAFQQIATVLLLTTLSHSPCDAQTSGMVEFSAFGKIQKGILLVDLAHELIILGRDGWIHTLDPRSPDSNRQRLEAEPFKAASAAEIRNRLRSEFGPDYEVLSTKTVSWFNLVAAVSDGRIFSSNPTGPLSAT